MKKTDAWMPLWIGAYHADTQRLTRDQHGGYLLLIMDYWRNGPPPDDDEILRTITKATPAQWKKLRPVLSGFFQIADGRWLHKRVEHELEQSRQRKEKAGGKAKAAAQARWDLAKSDTQTDAHGTASSNAPSNAPSIRQALHEQCPTPTPTPTPPPTASSLRSDAQSVGADAREQAPTLAGEACRLMRECGAQRVNPSDPRLLQLLSQGVTPRQLGDLAGELREARGAPQNMALVVATMAGRLRDAAAMPHHPDGTVQRAAGARAPRESTEEHNRRAIAQFLGDPIDDGRTIDA